jgi:hypothetical protein
MKISFPKYGRGDLLTRNGDATRIISFVAIAFFAGVCGSYLLRNNLWLLIVRVLGVAGILLCVGAGALIFLNRSKVDRAATEKSAPSAPIEESMAEFTPQWDYRPSRPIRGRGVLDSPSREPSHGCSSDFGINNNIWLNDHPLEGVSPTFINDAAKAEEPVTKALPQIADAVSAAPTADQLAVSRYD